MAARTRKIKHDDFTRERIRTTQLVKRLQDHVDGTVELSSTQVSAALGLLKKSLPDLSSTALTDPSGGALQINIMRFTESA